MAESSLGSAILLLTEQLIWSSIFSCCDNPHGFAPALIEILASSESFSEGILPC